METFNAVRDVALLVALAFCALVAVVVIFSTLLAFSTRGARQRRRLADAAARRRAQIDATAETPYPSPNQDWTPRQLAELGIDDPEFDQAWIEAHRPEGFSHPSRGS